jgi:hypothetical protein
MVLICCERKMPLVGWLWLVAGKPSEQGVNLLWN